MHIKTAFPFEESTAETDVREAEAYHGTWRKKAAIDIHFFCH